MAQENSFRENLKKEAALQKEQSNAKLQSNGTLADFFLEGFLPMDLHIHTVASGHGSMDTITDLAKAGAERHMLCLGISDHGPATPGSCEEPYFRSLKMAPQKRAGIRLLYGVEANILDENGRLDLSMDTLKGLDYCIASIHPKSFQSPFYHRQSFWNHKQVTEDVEKARHSNTQAYIRAMENPYVRILGHPDDTHYPVEEEALVEACVRYHVILEVNEASLSPEGYRGDTRPVITGLLKLCLEKNHPILVSSDSHGAKGVGKAPLSKALLSELSFPKELIVNTWTVERFLQFGQSGKRE